MIKMAVKKNKFKRRTEGKTNYRKRYHLLLSHTPRFVVRITNTRLLCQIIEYKEYQDKTILSFSSDLLKNFKWEGAHKNISCAYLTGYACAKIAAKKRISKIVVDIGLRKPQKKGRLFACVKGAIDGGLSTNADEKIFPDESKIKGEFIKKEKLFNSVLENIKKI
ncbi:MAG: 50S ribosomal protein L18 [Candidatus Nanohalarchaeota archaeon]|nr:MAG: 50S ribosomal protein L18 [Candidatus Nanohaloarchaeota archaeon]